MKTLNQAQVQTIAGGLSQDQIDWIDAFLRKLGQRGSGFPEPSPEVL